MDKCNISMQCFECCIKCFGVQYFALFCNRICYACNPLLLEKVLTGTVNSLVRESVTG